MVQFQAKRVRSVALKDDNHIVFEDKNNGEVKLNKISRTALDSLVSQGKQLDIINNAQTILTKSNYQNGNIKGIDLYADQGTGAVRLSLFVTAGTKSYIYMGRVDSGNWVACANTPVELDGTVDELLHLNGNSNEVNIIFTSNSSFYCEGH